MTVNPMPLLVANEGHVSSYHLVNIGSHGLCIRITGRYYFRNLQLRRPPRRPTKKDTKKVTSSLLNKLSLLYESLWAMDAQFSSRVFQISGSQDRAVCVSK